ncbi:MAG TPA: DUF2779 domain-containing protein [Patescibacteria group bacterium]|nr:DUF2779 domain-containing protein [Patescibacteria group bacterium]
MTLSKSDYLLFLKHPAWLWLKKHDRRKLPPVDENLQAVFDAGHMFEKYAEKLFPGGVTLGFSEDDFDTYLSLPARTTQALRDGATTIFQGRFESNNITCICDVVVKVNDSTVDLYEIKSSTEAKELHEHDLAFQMIVLESCGYTVRTIKVLHANNTYVRQGAIDPQQLVMSTDITETVKEMREDTKYHITKALEVMAAPTIPDISPIHAQFQSLGEWIEIYKTFHSVSAGSIYSLCRLNVKLIEELEDRHIEMIADIPEDIALRPQQKLQVRATKENKVLIRASDIRTFLSQFVFPLYFLDYETLANVVPEFDGTRSYQQVPFQYSLHILDAPGSEVRHVSYLHTEKTNPVLPLSQSLLSHIGTTGTVLVWHESFEKGRNTEMGELFPEFKAFYREVNKRIIDLKIPFSEGWYVHKDFLGSASIKKVLPVLVPELSYTALDIHEGNSAQRLWMETVLEGEHAAERAKVFQNLDKYCTLDTRAMVRIYEKLTAI